MIFSFYFYKRKIMWAKNAEFVSAKISFYKYKRKIYKRKIMWAKNAQICQ